MLKMITLNTSMLDNHEGPLEGHLRDALWMVVDRNCPSMVPAGSCFLA
jgi:hypothetical protein